MTRENSATILLTRESSAVMKLTKESSAIKFYFNFVRAFLDKREFRNNFVDEKKG